MEGFSVDMRNDGEAGLAAALESKSDLVILDVMMDHMSEGFDVARVLRHDDVTALIPIIILTGVDHVFIGEAEGGCP